jgi:hypothetical protein
METIFMKKWAADVYCAIIWYFPYILVHELGHILFAFIQGIPLLSVNFNMVGIQLLFARNTFLITAGGLLLAIPYLYTFYKTTGITERDAYLTLIIGIIAGSSLDIFTVLRMLFGFYPF